MICLSLIFLNNMSEGIFGKSFLVNPEKVAICAVWEALTIDLIILCWLV